MPHRSNAVGLGRNGVLPIRPGSNQPAVQWRSAPGSSHPRSDRALPAEPSPPPAPAIGTDRRRPRALRIGFLPLADAAPLLAGEALGLFARAGLQVSLSAETAWAALRDKLAFGLLDAAQLLGPMPIALALGLGAPARRLTVAAGLGQNGNTVVLSRAVVAAGLGEVSPPLDPARLAALVRRRAAVGRDPLRLAVVHAHSSHNYLLRHWLAAGGLDPDRDVALVVVPPPLLAQALRDGRIDGFCAGEPWGSHAVASGAGALALSTADIWPDHPEKLLAFAEGAAEAEPEAALALTAAVIEAARWLDEPANGAEAARLLQARLFPDLDPALLADAFAGRVAGTPLTAPLRFRAATRPDPAAAGWWLGAMRRWGHLPPGGADLGAALAPWRNRLWAEAAARLSEPPPIPSMPPPAVPATATP
jgi:ABC-type nitrate/sulfonate/bicarbonate transport system substrate-binding protein